MKLYYSPGACSLADHIALAESGLAYDLVKVDLRAKTTEDGRDFTGVNPKGYVPALELDDGAVLTENIAILNYIAATTGTLMPQDGMPRWRTLEATAFISTEVHKNFGPIFRKAGEAAETAAREMLAKRFATLDAQLGGREFLIGDTMTIADCYLTVMMLWAVRNQVEVPAGLAAYRDGMMRRPAVQRALAEEGLN